MCCQAFSLDNDIFVFFCPALFAVKSRFSGFLTFCLFLSNRPIFAEFVTEIVTEKEAKKVLFTAP